MTRESKIALLVGLIFIICFGVILSEARTDKIEQTPASVRLPVDAGVTDRIDRLEPMVVVRPREFTDRTLPAQPVAQPADPAPIVEPESAAPRPVRIYTVVAGDSLSKIASKAYGRGGRREYMRIFEANRDVLRDPSGVRPGQKLRIPPPEGPATGEWADTRRWDVRVREMDADEVREYLTGLEHSQTSERSTRPAGRTYTIRRGDTLTAIARRLMGDGSRQAVRRLHQLNRSIIADPNRLRIGAVLVIPE